MIRIPKEEEIALRDLEILIGEPPEYEVEDENISELDLSSKGLEKLPNSIINLTYLRYLNLNNNKLTNLPKFIYELLNLESLEVGFNRLENLSDSIGNLSKLIVLDVQYNRLEELPESISKLPSLRILTIEGNYIKTIPESILEKEELTDVKDSFNLPLIFTYFPYVYDGEEDDEKNLVYQKHILSKLSGGDLKSYFWYYITNIESRGGSSDSLEHKWSCKLYKIDQYNEANKRIRIMHKEVGKTLPLEHRLRKDNFIQFQLVIDFRGDQELIYLAPLIRSITITVETNRGDLISLIFTDFYFKKTSEKQVRKKFDIEYQKTAYLKFDPGYSIEPYAKLNFIDVKVEFESSLIPESSDLTKIHTEIRNLRNKIEKLLEQKQKINVETTQKIEFNTNEEENRSLERATTIFNNFKNSWVEPLLPSLILKIGKNPGSWLGKYAEYLAAGVIIAGALPSLLLFLYRFSIGIFQWGGIDFFTTDISNISVPVFFEILTYLPLFVLFVYLTIKFTHRQRIRQKEKEKDNKILSREEKKFRKLNKRLRNLRRKKKYDIF
ncbi:MAG: leucine-rich repeat domain-containing protein [Candidatus Thorarchaeota archaeon]